MSTPEQPDTPQLTRRQLREIRNTGVTPVVTPEDLEKAAAEPARPEPAPAPAAAPLARAAEPVPVAEPPVSDASVDLGVSPLTRRQARQQERIRTASVPVITPEVAAAHTGTLPAADATPAPPVEHKAPVEIPSWWPAVASQAPASTEPSTEWDEPSDAGAEPAESDDVADADGDDHAQDDEHVDDVFAPISASQDESGAASTDSDADADADTESDAEADELVASETGERPILNPRFGAELLSGDSQTDPLPPSFDQLITRSTTGSVATNSLIMAQSSGPSPIVAPVTATGDVLITGTLNLPEGLGSIGHVPGAADGKEVDAVLVDGELPAHSSPTPIAASSAISTVKSAGDVIRPPAPEKGSKLMISLAITAGVLALALVGVLIVAIWTGVFQ